jgi:hypothetical protein
MFDFLLGAGAGYLLAHYPPARLSALWAKVLALFGKQ